MLRGVTQDQYMGYILVNVMISPTMRQNSASSEENQQVLLIVLLMLIKYL